MTVTLHYEYGTATLMDDVHLHKGEGAYEEELLPSRASHCDAVKELNLNYHNSETIIFAIYPYHGTLK